MSLDPKAYLPFTCTECRWEEIPARKDHGILPDGRILCRECFAAYDGEIDVFCPDRAAAVAVLTARGQMTPVTDTTGRKYS